MLDNERQITPEQTRAARGWLAWSQTALAQRAGVGVSTVQDFERGTRRPIANNVAAIRRAIEAAGIIPLFEQDGSAAGIARRGARIDLP